MSNSPATIANIALRKMGVERISNITDQNDRAEVMNDLFADSRDFCLKLTDWNFAGARKALVADAVAPAFGFTYRYPLPTEPLYLAAIKLNGADDTSRDDGDFFKVEGKFLLTEEDTANLLYTSRVTDTLLFSPEYSQVLAAYLGAQSAYALTHNRKMEEMAIAWWEGLRDLALQLNAGEDFLDDASTSPFVHPDSYLSL